MIKLNPYLTFVDNCEEAFNFYKSVFGGEFTYVGRFKDSPPEYAGDPADGEKIMHISLPLGEGTMLMGSDTPASMAANHTPGTNITLTLSPDSEEETNRLFNQLSGGGIVTMPLDKTFWGSYFGMVTDKFGINWMLDYELPTDV